MSEKESCGTCKYFGPIKDSPTGGCFRYPPTVDTRGGYIESKHDLVIFGHGLWPLVYENLVCGEYKAREEGE